MICKSTQFSRGTYTEREGILTHKIVCVFLFV